MDDMIYHDSPTIYMGSNSFTDVPTIIRYRGEPLFEVAQVEQAGYTTLFRIHHSDGTYLTKVKGSRLFETEEARKAGVRMRHDPLVTACEMGGKTLFEIRRAEAAALKTSAELYTPDGLFIKATGDYYLAAPASDGPLMGLTKGDESMILKDFHVVGGEIGIDYVSDDEIRFGVGGSITQEFDPKTAPVPFPGAKVVYLKMEPIGDGPVGPASNLSLQYVRTPSLKLSPNGIFNGLVANLDALIDKLEAADGPIIFAALMGIDQSSKACEFVIAADWVERGLPASAEYLARHLGYALTKDQRSMIRNCRALGVLDTGIVRIRSMFAHQMRNGPLPVKDQPSPSHEPIFHVFFRCAEVA